MFGVCLSLKNIHIDNTFHNIGFVLGLGGLDIFFINGGILKKTKSATMKIFRKNIFSF